MKSVVIARIDRPIPELGYVGNEKYVLEQEGEYVGEARSIYSAVYRALEILGEVEDPEFVQDDCADSWGRVTWTLRSGS